MIKYEASDGRIRVLEMSGTLPEMSAEILEVVHMLYVNFGMRQPMLAAEFKSMMMAAMTEAGSPVWDGPNAADGEYFSAMIINRPEGRGKL